MVKHSGPPDGPPGYKAGDIWAPGPPIPVDGPQWLTAEQAAAWLAQYHGVPSISSQVVQLACRRYRERLEGRKKLTEPPQPLSRLAPEDYAPRENELRCTWIATSNLWQIYLVDPSEANLTNLRLNLPATAATAGDYAPSVGVKVGTRTGRRGSRARLTAEDVKKMRKLFKRGTPIFELARQFDVTHTTASNAVRGRSWKNVPE